MLNHKTLLESEVPVSLQLDMVEWYNKLPENEKVYINTILDSENHPQIQTLKQEIEWLNSDKEELEDRVYDLENEINNLEDEVSSLNEQLDEIYEQGYEDGVAQESKK